MTGIWSLIASIGAWALATFIKDLKQRADMEASFNAFIANRQNRADATVEIKNNGDLQSGNLDEIQRKLEHKDAPTVKTPPVATVEIKEEINMALAPAKVLAQAKKYLGQAEIAGSRDNPFIIACFKFTNYGAAAHDEIPWCSAFANRVVDEAGGHGSNSAAAASWKTWGNKSPLVPGAICVFQWANGEHHVTICDHVIDSHTAAFLGGNQSNTVKVSTYELKYLVACRVAA